MEDKTEELQLDDIIEDTSKKIVITKATMSSDSNVIAKTTTSILPKIAPKSANISNGQIVLIQSPAGGGAQTIRIAGTSTTTSAASAAIASTSSLSVGNTSGGGIQLIKTADGHYLQVKQKTPITNVAAAATNVAVAKASPTPTSSSSATATATTIGTQSQQQQASEGTRIQKIIVKAGQSIAVATSKTTKSLGATRTYTMAQAEQMGLLSAAKIKEILSATQKKPLIMSASASTSLSSTGTAAATTTTKTTAAASSTVAGTTTAITTALPAKSTTTTIATIKSSAINAATTSSPSNTATVKNTNLIQSQQQQSSKIILQKSSAATSVTSAVAGGGGTKSVTIPQIVKLAQSGQIKAVNIAGKGIQYVRVASATSNVSGTTSKIIATSASSGGGGGGSGGGQSTAKMLVQSTKGGGPSTFTLVSKNKDISANNDNMNKTNVINKIVAKPILKAIPSTIVQKVVPKQEVIIKKEDKDSEQLSADDEPDYKKIKIEKESKNIIGGTSMKNAIIKNDIDDKFIKIEGTSKKMITNVPSKFGVGTSRPSSIGGGGGGAVTSSSSTSASSSAAAAASSTAIAVKRQNSQSQYDQHDYYKINNDLPKMSFNVVELENRPPSIEPIENVHRSPEAPRRKHCNCTKSQCLKLYCDCFANGEFCFNCNCKECFNNLENEEDRQKAIQICLERNPHAFKPKIGKSREHNETLRRHTKGCNCKRSGCLKNYCECYEAKIACSGNCKCIGCRNVDVDGRVGYVEAMPPASMSINHPQQPIPKSIQSKNRNVSVREPSPSPFNAKKPFNFMTLDVIEATVQCVIAQADECEQKMLDKSESEKLILEEFGRCLVEIIEFPTKNNEN